MFGRKKSKGDGADPKPPVKAKKGEAKKAKKPKAEKPPKKKKEKKAKAPKPKKQRTPGQKVAIAKQLDVFTVMLGISFLAVTISCLLLLLELSTYGSFPWWKVS